MPRTMEEVRDAIHGVRDDIRDMKDSNSEMKKSNDDLRTEVRERLDKNDKGRNFAYLIAGLCLVAAIAGAAFGVVSRIALSNQTDTNEAVICASARSTADAFREPIPGESNPHFLRRMSNQRTTLLLADDLDCGPDFKIAQGRALIEIGMILDRGRALSEEESDRLERETNRALRGFGPTSDPDDPGSSSERGDSPPSNGTAATDPDEGEGSDSGSPPGPSAKPPGEPNEPTQPTTPTKPKPTPTEPAEPTPTTPPSGGNGGLPKVLDDTLGGVGSGVGETVCGVAGTALPRLCP